MRSGVESLSASSAARGVASGVGSGKMKNLQAKQLWTQGLVPSGKATIGRVPRLLTSPGALINTPLYIRPGLWSGRSRATQAEVYTWSHFAFFAFEASGGHRSGGQRRLARFASRPGVPKGMTPPPTHPSTLKVVAPPSTPSPSTS